MKKIFREKYDYETLSENERQYDHIDLRTTTCVDAVYVKSFIPEDNGNRFIEALPRPRNLEESKLAYNMPLLSYDYEKERSLPSEQRELMVYRLQDVRFPLPHQATLEQAVYNSLCLSYRARYRTEDAEMGFDINLGNGAEMGHSKLLGDASSAANAGFALLGYSGSGKSSTLHNLLSIYPQVIFHHINGYRIPQIVHLVVNCVPNSNFAALYVGIGNAIDRALGLDMVYEKMISRMKSLGDKAEKVRQLVEQFSIGIIIFDEIQLIDFSTTKENSFESLMVLTNRTKVAIGVVGTTDAYDKMFTCVRTARRVGVLVSSCQYCDNKAFFAYLVQNLMRYQWFDSPVSATQEIIDALYANTHGIIDQLVSIYICMHIEYLNKKTRPKVDAAFINRVAEKYYPQMRKLLETMEKPENDRRIRELVQNTQKQLEARQDEVQQKVAGQSIIESQATAIDLETLEKNVLANIRNVTDDYSTDTIHDAFIKVVSRKRITDESAVTKAVFQQLQKGRGDKRPTRKCNNKIPHEVMQQKVLSSVS